jgi:hypothetical protein
MDNRRRLVPQADDPRPPRDIAWAEAEVIDLDPVRPSARGPRVGTIFTGAFLVLVALIGLAGFPPGIREATTPADGTAKPPTSVATVAAETIAPATPDASAWATIELHGYGRGATVENLWSLGDLFVAELETDEGPDGGPYGPVLSVLMTSTDGLGWDRIDLPAREFIVEAGTVEAGRLWILGYEGLAEDAPLQLWSTDDGTWRHEADPEGLVERPERVTAFEYRSTCETDADCLAVGWVAAIAEAQPGADRLVVSDDGRSWAASEPGEERELSIIGIEYTRRGWIAAAVAPGESGLGVTIVLRSDDRLTWSTNLVTTSRGGGRDIAAGVAGIAIVGTEENQGSRLPRVWLSSDGEGWLRVSGETAFGRAPAAMDHVTATAHGYLAMSGRTGDAWISTDGELWRNLSTFVSGPGDEVRVIASAGDVLLAAGRSTAGRPAFWAGRLSRLLGQY